MIGLYVFSVLLLAGLVPPVRREAQMVETSGSQVRNHRRREGFRQIESTELRFAGSPQPTGVGPQLEARKLTRHFGYPGG